MDYYIGLDVGSASVGWAVCDENYNLCKYKKKDMWGIRLFETAITGVKRRVNRANRRRLERRKQRIDLLQEIFAKEIANIDDTFFLRLNESRLYLEDKKEKSIFTLFKDENYTDIDYYKQYPTIFHLRKELIANEKEHDIRLVYLALHHIIKNRGHFLIQGDIGEAKDFFLIFNNMIATLNNELDIDLYIGEKEKKIFKDILSDKSISRSDKAKSLASLFSFGSEKFDTKVSKTIITEICKLVVGNKGSMSKIFQKEKEDFEVDSFSFSESKYEESIREKLDEELLEQAYLVDLVKAVYDWKILDDILQDEEYLSFAKVKYYEEHSRDLKALRYLVLKYCTKEIYNDFFNSTKDKSSSYSSYIGEVKKNGKKYGVKQGNVEDFYKEIKKILDKIQVEATDEEIKTRLVTRLEAGIILPLQRNKDNGVIPYQVHELELKKILENTSKYLAFLNIKDEDGISNIDKIISLFKFRIPYFVGPLSDRHKIKGSNTWIVRKKEGRIYPWNFDKMVDLEKSNEEFIARMTNKCTYLVGEDVLAKNSLLYSKFMVLNELNNLRIRGNKISEKLKQNIYEDLFKNSSKVTGKKLLDYLRKDLPELKKEDLSGFDIDFKSSLTSYLDFKKKVFGDRIEDENIQNAIENIIKWITIYGDDKKMLKNIIKREYGHLITAEEIKSISKLNYSGWGNFSKKFLKEIIGADKETGESFNIIDALWSTNNNLMQLLSSNFTFTELIDSINKEKLGEVKSIDYENVVKDIYASPAIKRAIWQSVEIVEEIKKLMGKEPKRIFLEMARGEEKDKKGKRTTSRKEWLKALYQNCEKDIRERFLPEIENIDERDFNSRKLFLYYTQMGKCMYTGENIDLDELMKNNSKWDKDHIFPQSKIKDDSLDNMVLVNKTINNAKTNEVLSKDIQNKMKGFWISLLNKGFISKKKYDRLMKKGAFTDEELAGFINRQLVETRQATKVLADTFKTLYQNSALVYVKASLVSDFRHKNIGFSKSRRVNDYHHAKDAYLNIVVGNVYNAKFTDNPINWIRSNKNIEYSLNKIFDYNVYRRDKLVWNANKSDGSINIVRKVMESNNILYTERTYCSKGQLFNATIQRKNENSSIALKSYLDRNKYGGYNSPPSSYFALIEFEDKKNTRVRNIIAVPLYIDIMQEHNPRAFLDYCENVKGLKNIKIIYPKIKKNSLLLVDGFPMRIRGENETVIMFKNNIQLRVDKDSEELIRKVEKYLEKKADYEPDEKIDKIEQKDLIKLYDLFIEKFETIYAKRPSNQSKKLRELKDKFLDLKLVEKMKVIYNILSMLRCDASTTSDISLLGAGKTVGGMSVSKNTIGKNKLVLVNQSATGLFENRIKL